MGLGLTKLFPVQQTLCCPQLLEPRPMAVRGLQFTPTSSVAEMGIPSKPARALNPGLLPFSQRIRERYAGVGKGNVHWWSCCSTGGNPSCKHQNEPPIARVSVSDAFEAPQTKERLTREEGVGEARAKGSANAKATVATLRRANIL